MPKKWKKSNQKKSVDVNLEIPVTKSGFMLVILVILISTVGYAGILGVSSIWKFTHPQFNLSLDSFKSLGYIAKGVKIPPISGPTISNGYNIPESNTSQFLQSVNEFKSEFRMKHPDSKLLSIPDTDLLNLGWSLCQAKEKQLSDKGAFNKSEAVIALKAKLVLRYWQINGLSEFLDGISERTYQNLCGDN